MPSAKQTMKDALEMILYGGTHTKPLPLHKVRDIARNALIAAENKKEDKR